MSSQETKKQSRSRSRTSNRSQSRSRSRTDSYVDFTDHPHVQKYLNKIKLIAKLIDFFNKHKRQNPQKYDNRKTTRKINSLYKQLTKANQDFEEHVGKPLDEATQENLDDIPHKLGGRRKNTRRKNTRKMKKPKKYL